MSQFWTRSSGVLQGTPPICFNASPRDMVRFQYCRGGSDLFVRCLWILVAMARPMDPRPIHPRRGDSVADISDNCQLICEVDYL
jgi:hypothetical protein